MNLDKYNIAIVGCGSMGVENLFEKSIPFTYSFAGAVFNNSRAELVALVDVDQTKLGQICSRLIDERYVSIIAGYNCIEEAVEMNRNIGQPIDIVCCAAGPQANAEVIRKAATLGVRGVYCEKPLVLSLAEADELAKIEAESGLKAQVNYLRNFDTCHLAVLNYLRNGGIGELLCVRCLYKGGVMAVAPHTFALLHMLFGRPLSVLGYYSPLLNTRCLEDPNIDGIIRYHFAPQGRDINVSLMSTGRGEIINNTYLFEFEFTGTKARITLMEDAWQVRYEEMRPSRIFESLGTLVPYDTTRIPPELKADTPREFMIEGLQQLIDAIENDSSTNCSIAMARDAEEVTHALAISAEETRTIYLPLADRTHAFANATAGVKVLKQEAGITD